ncbi:MAG: TauD/TfdA dioxygenase family protein [Hyphomicrobiaceae bacterium]
MGDLSVRKLHPCLGAEFRGVDFTKPLSDNAVEEILGAWADHLVLIFPDQPVSEEQHVDVTRFFGEPEVFHQDILKSTSVAEIFRVSNTDEDGNIVPATHPTMKQLSGARKWHTESSYREKPAVGSLLHGIEVSRTGGLTCFTNMYAVYEALPENLKSKIENRRARHDFEMLSRELGARKPTEEERCHACDLATARAGPSRNGPEIALYQSDLQ